MAMKKKIDKEEFGKLAKEMQALYVANGENYVLDLEDDDTGELRRAKKREAEDAAALRVENKKLADELEALKTAGTKAVPKDAPTESEALKAAEARAAKAEREAVKAKTESEEKDRKRQETIKRNLIKNTADALAKEISTTPSLMSRVIAERLEVTFDEDNEPIVSVLGKDGKPSDRTMTQLAKEIRDNAEYSGIIIASKASGSGAPDKPKPAPSAKNGDGTDTSNRPDAADPMNMSHAETAKWAADRAAARKAEAAAKG